MSKGYKYLSINGDMIWGKNEINKERLVMVKDGRVGLLINTEDVTFYNPDTNSWDKIKGDE